MICLYHESVYCITIYLYDRKSVVFMYFNYLVAVMAQKVIGHGIVFKLFQSYCDIGAKTVLNCVDKIMRLWHNKQSHYFALQFILQSQCLALQDGTLRAGEFKSGSVFIEGSYQIKLIVCVWMYKCYLCIKTQLSKDVHMTSHCTRLNVEFARLIAKCNITTCNLQNNDSFSISKFIIWEWHFNKLHNRRYVKWPLHRSTRD